MTHQAKATFAGSTSGRGIRRGLFGIACLCVLGLAAFLGSGAPSAVAASCPNESFRTGPSAHLPDCRAYEQVSPPQKNAADVMPDATRVRASVNGNRVIFSSLTGFGDAQGTALSGDYMALRNPDNSGRWSTHAISPPQDATGYFNLLYIEPRYELLSSDLSRGVLLTREPLTDAANVAGSVNYYLRQDLLDSGSGSYTLLTDSAEPQTPGTLGTGFVEPVIAGASSDFSHILFESKRRLIPAAPPCAEPPQQCPPLLYEWIDGELRLPGILPADEGGGVAPISQAGYGATHGLPANAANTPDASRFIFTVPASSADPGGALYLHDEHGTIATADDESIRIAASERTDCDGDVTCGGDGQPDPAPDPAGPAPETFQAASSDLSTVFFTTTEQLTDDDTNASNDVYRWTEQPDGSGHHLTLVSLDKEPTDGINPEVAGVIGISQDGSYAYFITTQDQLVAGGPTGNAGGPSGDKRIFVWHGGALREVGGVNGGPETFGLLGGAFIKTSRVTPDGKHLAFITEGTDELLSLYGHPPYDHGHSCADNTFPECAEVYVYDATANGGAGDLRCASCNPTGAPATVDASFRGSREGVGVANGTGYLNHPLSDDGRYLFFNTSQRLSPEDQNDALDAYVYDTTTHRADLISSGQGAANSTFLDATPDGSDVFFTTRDRLRSSDADESRDLYDARIGGGAADAQPTAPCADLESCRGPEAPPSAPDLNLNSSTYTSPGGGARHPRRKTHHHRRHPGRRGGANRGGVR